MSQTMSQTVIRHATRPPSRRAWAVLLIAAALAVAAPPAGAQQTAPQAAPEIPADPALRESLKDALFDQLKAAGSAAEGDAIADRIWRIWVIGPDDAATETLRFAMERRDLYDFAGAHEILDTLVADYPEWSEPWNQRAFVRFLQERYDPALEDIDETLAREPRHFGALTGKALTLMRQGRMQLGQKALREALEVHPWARERSMLLPLPGDEAPPGEGKGGKQDKQDI